MLMSIRGEMFRANVWDEVDDVVRRLNIGDAGQPPARDRQRLIPTHPQ
jgi:hypothetical protein